MRYDSEEKKLYVRQSWLGTYLICPQRSRYDMTMPKLRRGSDATAIGTGVHHAIEQYLLRNVDTLEDMVLSAREAVSLELADESLRRTDISADEAHMFSCVDAMVTSWYQDIRPLVPLGGLVEHKFKAQLLEGTADTVPLWLEGTMDYVAPDGSIWDWKTASRSYSAKEKQKQSHQATCYVVASRELGLVPDTDEPTAFRFGVMLRQPTPKSQVITVHRDKGHVEWLKRQIASVATTALNLPLSVDWAMNDQHNLCSSKWCDYWSVCKGAHWSDGSMEPPTQIVPLATTDM